MPKHPTITVFELHDMPTIAEEIERQIQKIKRAGIVNPIAERATLATLLPLVSSERQRTRIEAMLHARQ